ncbi:hypothetical protein CTAYLR_008296 [Chrysophaeum taylorii]|uniref:PNPLA domain-containing protein n=1 Tax=Chrysophaeum taylorii TaxID=2483200 RepID=A0AAD7U7A4_9STRA|nr:hypothetical protein CTAYLR_008296 [Chrysophaeum taylorii]
METSAPTGDPLVRRSLSVQSIQSDAQPEATVLVPESELLAEEAAATARRRTAMGLGPASTHGIGVCFSGGGVRAASFDCGVLWKLNDLGLLKDVDHLSAVSGGGYTASAWVSHVAAGEPPPETNAEEIDAWYSLALAHLITRMQDNIGYLVTTSHSLFSSPGKKRGGAAYGRAWDVPAFAAILVGMPLANVATFVIFWAMPLASFINLNHGHSMRAYICSKGRGFSWFPNLATFGSVASVGLWLCFKVVDKVSPVLPDPPLHTKWLFHACTKILLSRTALVALVYGVLVVGAMGMEVYDYKRANESDKIKCACARFYEISDFYNTTAAYHAVCDTTESPPLANDRSFALRFLIVVSTVFAAAGLVAVLGRPSLLGLVARIVGPFIGILGVAYVAEWRVFGPVTRQRLVWGGLAYNAKLWSGLFFASCALAVADLPSRHELPRTLHRFYARSLRRAFFADAEDVPLAALRDDYAEETFGARPTDRVSMPTTTTTTDSPVHDAKPPQSKGWHLVPEAATPNLILGATINEFRRPEDPHTRGKMFVLTPRAWGGPHSGYARPPRWLSLSRAMAISGAAIDGFVLNAFKSKALRLALQVLNLTMGDTIRFSGVLADDDDARVKVGPVLAAAVETVQAPFGVLCGRGDDELAEKYQLRRRDRLVAEAIGCCPNACEECGAGIRVGDSLATDELASTLYSRRFEMMLFAAVYVLFMVSAAFYSKSDDRLSFFKTPSPIFASIAVVLMASAVASSVYAYLPNVRFLLASPIIQQVHILLQITHFGTRAPPAITLTDGGLTECIGIVELLRRRTRWIVVVDTTEDPNISLLYLRDSFDTARSQGLFEGDITDGGSPLVRPEDGDGDPAPRLTYAELLSPLVEKRQYARLKLNYPAAAAAAAAATSKAADSALSADVFVIKMRKPAPADRKCERLVEPREVVEDTPAVDATKLPVPLLDVNSDPLDLNQNEINGLCCECCHYNCKCLPCGELPFLSVGNQFLTPFQFANLCRLARELSDAPLKELKRVRGPVK